MIVQPSYLTKPITMIFEYSPSIQEEKPVRMRSPGIGIPGVARTVVSDWRQETAAHLWSSIPTARPVYDCSQTLPAREYGFLQVRPRNEPGRCLVIASAGNPPRSAPRPPSGWDWKPFAILRDGISMECAKVESSQRRGLYAPETELFSERGKSVCADVIRIQTSGRCPSAGEQQHNPNQRYIPL